MCGRYNFTVEENDELMEILEKLNAKFQNNEVRTGEIFPTDQAPILIEDRKRNVIASAPIAWGFPKFDGKGVIINARCETAFEKKTFRDSLMNRRCIIPSSGFYEWNSKKQKFLFNTEESKVLYMAGLYSCYGNEPRFVILTTAANESMQDIHSRMPLILQKQELHSWIMEEKATNDFLHRVPPQLIATAV